ncbi:helix-turn-helix domain-containing protein [Pedobacter sp. AW1-32]|uniref:helix-turn-helix domain-containing protein n=1 Tax=Pedobacter sp. AW1-32 TaxID=3383026 RepID=UPI003FEF470B
MNKDIKTYPFRPISNIRQELHTLTLQERISRGGDKVLVPHRTDFYLIYWFTKGHLTHMVDFEDVEIKPGTILFIAKNRIHKFTRSDDFDGRIIAFTEPFFCNTEPHTRYLKNADIFHHIRDVQHVQVTDANINTYTYIFDEIEQELKRDYDPYQFEILHNLLYGLLIRAERDKGINGEQIKPGIDLQRVTDFKRLLEKNFKDHFPVHKYAALIGISEKSLQQATAEVLGMTPKELINQRLILEAKRLLAYEFSSVKEISYALGFNEPTNFIKYFKKHSKQTPTEFRHSHV